MSEIAMKIYQAFGELTPQNIDSFNYCQALEQTGVVRYFPPEQLKKCQWQVSYLKKHVQLLKLQRQYKKLRKELQFKKEIDQIRDQKQSIKKQSQFIGKKKQIQNNKMNQIIERQASYASEWKRQPQILKTQNSKTTYQLDKQLNQKISISQINLKTSNNYYYKSVENATSHQKSFSKTNEYEYGIFAQQQPQESCLLSDGQFQNKDKANKATQKKLKFN